MIIVPEPLNEDEGLALLAAAAQAKAGRYGTLRADFQDARLVNVAVEIKKDRRVLDAIYAGKRGERLRGD